MKILVTTVGVALALACSLTAARAATLTGDYVEVRTASVFAGACHYGGQYLEDGRDAVMAWHVRGGLANGLNVIALVHSDGNLAEANQTRTSEIYVDSRATSEQRFFLLTTIAQSEGAALGSVVKILSSPIAFTRTADETFKVAAPGIASLVVDALPDRACCKQPNLVWYTPLCPVTERRVGCTEAATCRSDIADSWTRAHDNSAFYGTFKL